MKMNKLSKTTKSNAITYAIVIGAFLLVTILNSTMGLSRLFNGLLVPMCTYVVLAISLNLVVGISGELSLGHAGFMCVGAFASSFFSVCVQQSITNVWIRFPLAFLVGGLSAAIFGVLIGIPVLRLRGDYLAIVTLAFGEIIKNLVNVLYVGKDANGFHFAINKLEKLTAKMAPDGEVIIKGSQGISGTPRESTFIIGIILVIISLIIVLNLINSRAGRSIMAIRDNRIAAESIGINVTGYKLSAFTISAFLAGVAGVLYSHNLAVLSATPKNFGYNMSIMILVYVVLGGIGNMRGSIIAAVILTLLPEELRALSDYRMLIYAILLIFMMIFNQSPIFANFKERYSFKKLFEGRTKKGGAQ